MSTSRDGPNPLRPYYVPPLVGLPSEANSRISTTSKTHSEYGSASPRTTSFGSSTRDILADIDYSEYLSDSSPSTTARQLAEQAIWKYASVFLAQPFEIAKTILQVHATNRDVSPWKDRQEGENSCRKGITYQDRGDLYNVHMALLEALLVLTLSSFQTTRTTILSPTSLRRLLYQILNPRLHVLGIREAPLIRTISRKQIHLEHRQHSAHTPYNYVLHLL